MRLFRSLLILIAIALPAIALAQNANLAPTDEREWRVGEEMRRQLITLQQESGVSPDQLLETWRSQLSKGTKEAESNILHYTWEYLGPANQSGRVTELLSFPGSNQLVAGAAGGGIWRYGSDATWRVKTDSFPGLQMTACAQEPQNPAVMAMGTTQGFVYISTDSGATWRIAPKSPGSNVMSMTFHPTTIGVLYAATDGGLAVSSDLGNTWKAIAPGRARSVVINPLYPLVMYYGQMDAIWPYSHENIMKSIDGGKTFTKVFTQPQGYWSDVLFGMCKANPSVLWLGSDSADIYFRSSDGGTSWQQCAGRPWNDSYNAGFWCFFADPHDANTALAGGPALFRTTDAGANWTRIDTLIHVDFHAMTFPGGTRAVVGCDGGVYATDNYLASPVVWSYDGNGLITLQAYNVAGDPDGANTVITGNQDNGYAKYTADPTNWRIVGGDGFVTIYNPTDPTIFYHEYTDMNLHRANDGFTWWSTKVMNGLPTTTDFYTGITNEPVDWYGQGIAMDPTNPSTLYCGTDSLFVTTDNGDSWNIQSPQQLTRGSFVSAIAVSPADANTIYVGSNDGLLSFTHDHGATWDTTSQSQFAKQSGRIYSLACDPHDPATAYLSMQLGTTGTPLYRTTDGGMTWKSITNGLPATTTSKILVDPNQPKNLYVGISTGVCVSQDAGTTWQILSGLPNVQVIDLSWEFLDPGPVQCLLVASYGRGIIRGRIGSVYSSDQSIVFLKTRVGKTRDTTVSFFINNTGSTTMQASGLRIVGADSSQFKLLSGTGAFSLPANSSYAVTLRFAPTIEKSSSANVQLTFPDGTSQNISTIAGQGTIPVLQTLRAVNYGSVQLGALQDSTLTFSASNFADGPDTLFTSVVGIIGADSLSFWFENYVTSLSITAQASQTLKLACLPKTTGALTASAILHTNGQPTYDTITLSANAVSSVNGHSPSPTGLLVDILPNPASDVVHLKIQAGANLQGQSFVVHIIDEAGRLLSSHDQQGRFAAAQSMDLQINALASGAYTLQIVAGGALFSHRLMIER
jgi:photosystem II stability/assembly factor-like uncharacterized protein